MATHSSILALRILWTEVPLRLQSMGLPYSPPEDLSDPGIEPKSPTLQVDSLPAEPQGKPKSTGVDSLSLLQWIFPTREWNPGSPRLQADSLPNELSGKPRRRW